MEGRVEWSWRAATLRASEARGPAPFTLLSPDTRSLLTQLREGTKHVLVAGDCFSVASWTMMLPRFICVRDNAVLNRRSESEQVYCGRSPTWKGEKRREKEASFWRDARLRPAKRDCSVLIG